MSAEAQWFAFIVQFSSTLNSHKNYTYVHTCSFRQITFGSFTVLKILLKNNHRRTSIYNVSELIILFWFYYVYRVCLCALLVINTRRVTRIRFHQFLGHTADFISTNRLPFVNPATITQPNKKVIRVLPQKGAKSKILYKSLPVKTKKIMHIYQTDVD